MTGPAGSARKQVIASNSKTLHGARRLATAVIGALALLAAPAQAEDEKPLRIDVGLLTGFTSFDEKSGLGNANNPKDVPGAGALVGIQAGVVLLNNRLGIEAMFRDTFSEMRSGSSSVQVLGWRLRGLWYFLNEGRVQPYVMAGGGNEILINSKTQCAGTTVVNGCALVLSPDTDNGIEGGVGARVLLTHRLALRATAVLLLADGRPADPKTGAEGKAWGTNVQGEVGVTWSFGGAPEDTDKDGVPDDLDRCIEKPEDKDGFQDTDGCPDEDNDGDGLFDDKDKCRDQPEDMDKFQDEDGCPELDNDNDGIEDAKDKCPDKPETKNGFQDTDGCPDVADADGDGIVGDADKCPSQKEDKDGFQDTDGCPDPDNDGDGVLDAQDKCSDKAESKNGFKDDDGCPDDLPEAVAKLFAGPLTSVEFKSDKLNKGAEAQFTALLEFMLEQETVKLSIAVEPDAATEPATAQAKARAEAIKAWLADQGIAGDRIDTAASAPAAAPPKPGKGGVVKPTVTLKLR